MPAPALQRVDARRPAVVDVLVAGVALAVVLVGSWGAATVRGLPTPSLGETGLLVASATVLALAGRRPLLTLVLVGGSVTTYLALGSPYGPVLLTVGVASYVAARRTTVARALPVAAGVLVALALPLLWQTQVTPVSGSALDGLVGLVPLLAWVAVPFSVGYARRVRWESAERARAHAVAELLAGERLRLSRDVHDVVGHGLAAIKMQADVALHVAPSAATDPGTTALRAISSSAAAALAELREVLGGLGPTRAEPGSAGLGELPALRARVASAGLDLRWDVDDDLVGSAGVSTDVDRTAYRVLQEALTNVLRHGDAARPVHVRVRRGRDGMLLRVRNGSARADLPGRAGAPAVAGRGLAGMRERVEAVGGSLRTDRPDGDFVVEASLPVAEPG